MKGTDQAWWARLGFIERPWVVAWLEFRFAVAWLLIKLFGRVMP